MTRLHSSGERDSCGHRCPGGWAGVPSLARRLEIPGKVCLIPVIFFLSIFYKQTGISIWKMLFWICCKALWQLTLSKYMLLPSKELIPCTGSGESQLFNVHLQMLIHFPNKHYDWQEKSKSLKTFWGRKTDKLEPLSVDSIGLKDIDWKALDAGLVSTLPLCSRMDPSAAESKCTQRGLKTGDLGLN